MTGANSPAGDIEGFGSHFELTGASLAFGSATLVLVALLDGLLPQLQMIATGGHIPVPMLLVKFSLLALLALTMLLEWKTGIPSTFGRWWSVLSLYLVFDALFQAIVLHLSLSDILIGTNSYYGYFLMAPLAFSLCRTLSDETVRRGITAVFFLCFLVGTAQYLTQKPLLYLESLDGTFMALSWNSVDGGIRAFSLFSSGLAYGGFCCLAGAVAAARVLKRQHRVRWLGVLPCTAFACYTTTTRNCYTQFVLAMVGLFFLSKRPPRLARYLPIAFLLVAVVIATASIAVNSSSDSALTSNVSTLMRAAEWQYYVTLYQGAPLLQKLFGLGIVQNANASNDALVVLDNQFLGVLINAGLCGFLLVFWMQWKMWLCLYNNAVKERSALALAFAAFWSTYLAVYFFNVSLPTYSLVFILAIFSGTMGGATSRDQTLETTPRILC